MSALFSFQGLLSVSPEDEAKDSPETRVKKIAMELLQTEKAYVERLHLVDQVSRFIDN